MTEFRLSKINKSNKTKLKCTESRSDIYIYGYICSYVERDGGREREREREREMEKTRIGVHQGVGFVGGGDGCIIYLVTRVLGCKKLNLLW